MQKEAIIAFFDHVRKRQDLFGPSEAFKWDAYIKNNEIYRTVVNGGQAAAKKKRSR